MAKHRQHRINCVVRTEQYVLLLLRICTCCSIGEEGNGDGGGGEEEVLPPYPGHEEAVAAGEAESAHRHGRNLLQGGAQAQGPF